MKIALDATYSVGRNLTGVGVYSREILLGLPKGRPDTRFLFCFRPHRLLRSFEHFLPRGTHRGVLFDSWSPHRPDLFHGLNQRLPKCRFKKTITTFHDLFVLTGDYSTPEFRRRFAGQARDAAAASDMIIAVSEFTASQVEDLLSVPRERIRVVHHGVIRPAAAEAELIAPRKENIILSVGAIQKRKNIARMVRVFERLEGDWKLVLAGASDGFGASDILDQIERSKKRSSIHVLGYVTDKQLEDLYGRASMFFFPSLDEGFGIPVLEAMARGVPVITSNRSALPEAAGDAAVIVDPTDEDEMLLAVRTVAGQSGFRKELARRGFERVAGMTWKKAVEETWNCYTELLGRPV